MTEFTSDIQPIPHSREAVFATLSDLNHLEGFKSFLPENLVHDLEFDTDYCQFKIDAAGLIRLKIIEREIPKTIKLESEKSPVSFTCWIQLVEAGINDTYLKLTVRANIPLMLKPMLSKPLEKGVNQAAITLANLPY